MPFFDVRVCEMRNLPRLGFFKQYPDVFFTLEIDDKQFVTSTSAGVTSNPQWEEAFRFSCRTVRNDPLVIKLHERNDGISALLNRSTVLGVLNINLDHPKFVQGIVNDQWHMIVMRDGTCEVRLRILAHDFGTVNNNNNNNNNHAAFASQQQQQREYYAPIPEHALRLHSAQVNAVSVYAQQQLILQQQYQASQLYPVAPINSVNTTQQNYNSQIAHISPPRPLVTQSQKQSFWARNNDNNQHQRLQTEAVMTGETLQSAQADLAFFANAPTGYIVPPRNN